MPKTLYVSDLDGTLLRGDARISDVSKSILETLIGRGMCFTFATARSIVSAAPCLRGLLPSLPVIVRNGAFVYDMQKKRNLHENFFTGDMVRAVREYLTAHEIYPIVYTHDASGDHVSWLAGKETPCIADYVKDHEGDPRLLPANTPDDLYGKNIYYIRYIGGNAETLPIFQAFRENPAFQCYHEKEFYTDNYWCDLTPAQATKAGSILWLKKHYGFERIVCFGDASNDIPMFSISDERCAMENASDALKALATEVIPSNEEDGVAHWLQAHFTDSDALKE